MSALKCVATRRMIWGAIFACCIIGGGQLLVEKRQLFLLLHILDGVVSPSLSNPTNVSEWQCHTSNESKSLDAEMLMNDVTRNGTSRQNPMVNYNDPTTCEQMGKSLLDRPNHSILVHVFYPFGKGIDSRKKHLMMLSFLATQCSTNSKLILWHKHNNETPILPPMALHLLDRIQVRQFDYREIEEMGFGKNTTKRLIHEYENAHMAGSTDIARVTILYNHGGIWIDSDVLLLRSLSPISGLDFVYQADQNYLNGAVMGASTKRSKFVESMIRYIDTCLEENPIRESYFKWAHNMFNHLYKTGGHMPFLPGCLFDGGWVRRRRAADKAAPVDSWNAFFSKRASERHVRYIDPTIARHQGPLAYHWHGRWNATIVDGSLADCADRMYRKALGIPFYNSSDTVNDV